MKDVLKGIADFLRSRRAEVTVGPSIKIDYHTYSWNKDVKLALKDQWEKLQQELNLYPRCIKERKWESYGSGKRYEDITIDIEGVIMKLSGPQYPDPDYEKPEPEPVQTDEEKANEGMDQLLHQTSISWVMTHCSRSRFETFVEFLRSGRMTQRSKGGE